MRSLFLITSAILASGLTSCLYYPPQQRPPGKQGPGGQVFMPGQQQRQSPYQQGRTSQPRRTGTTGGPIYQGGQNPNTQPQVVIEGYQDPRVNPGVSQQPAPQEVAPTQQTVAPTPPVSNAEPSGGYPYATPVPGKSGMVYSPYAREKGWVDVSGIAPGTKVTDPHTNKIFLVP